MALLFNTISELTQEAVLINEEILTVFGDLTEEQLNWKPAAEKWSVGQCIQHLIQTKIAYDTSFERLKIQKTQRTFLQKIGILNSFFGNVIFKAIQTPRKVKTFPAFEPGKSNIPADIIAQFQTTQRDMIEIFEGFKGFDLKKVIVHSPISTTINFSLLHCLNILVTHERRHINQAKRVMEMEGFPK